MFGYIYVNEQELKIREFTAYRSFYCGLCRNLHLRYGRIAQMMLNYDLTFLALLHTGLYEPQTTVDQRRCLVHPVSRHLSAQNEAISYAADMCVLLSYQKLQDNWQDENNLLGMAGSALLKKDYKELKKKYPRQAAAIEKNIELLHTAEQENLSQIDEVAGYTGRFLAEIFVWKDDCWQEDLRGIGFFLGKFIYLMDALDDLPSDKKHNRYNLFRSWENFESEESQKKIYDILTDMMQNSAQAFERLPILENAEILRNILYSGVWCKYALIKSKREKSDREK